MSDVEKLLTALIIGAVVVSLILHPAASVALTTAGGNVLTTETGQLTGAGSSQGASGSITPTQYGTSYRF